MQHPQPNPTPGPAPNPTSHPSPPTSPSGPTVNPTPSPTGAPPDHNKPTGVVSYPIQRLLNAAEEVRRNAHDGLDKLFKEENKLTSYAREFPDVMYGAISELFKQYKDHVESCCNSQLIFAKWLEQAGYEMQQTDGQIKTSFDQFAKTHGPD